MVFTTWFGRGIGDTAAMHLYFVNIIKIISGGFLTKFLTDSKIY